MCPASAGPHPLLAGGLSGKVRISNGGLSFALAPATTPVNAIKPRQLSNPAACGECLDLLDIANDLEIHGLSDSITSKATPNNQAQLHDKPALPLLFSLQRE
jgi:hypothetical protein